MLMQHKASIREFEDEHGKMVEKLQGFLQQPFHVNQSSIPSIVDFWRIAWATIFKDRPPEVVTIVRSPFYTPHHHLSSIECLAVRALTSVFGAGGGFYHGEELEVNRTGCVQSLPGSAVNVGPMRHIHHKIWEENVHDLFFRDEGAEDSTITAIFVNDHPGPVILEDQHDSQHVIKPGKHLKRQCGAGSKWRFLDEANPSTELKAFTVSRKHGTKQRFSSVLGRLAVTDHTPVVLKVSNPEGGSPLELHYQMQDSEPEHYRSIEPGEQLSIDTFHGHSWMLHAAQAKEGTTKVAEMTIDAMGGGSQRFEVPVTKEL